jgi:hypothetical protein
MEPGKMAKQMIAFQKNLIENSLNSLSVIQDQTETMANAFMSQLPWVPEEGKKAIGDAVNMYKKAFNDYKKAVSEGFSKMEELFTAE